MSVGSGTPPVDASSGAPTPDLLRIRGLTTHFFTRSGTLPAVDGVDLGVRHGETLGLVGESGCGKSMTALSIMGLVDRPGRIVAGAIEFKGRDLLRDSEAELRSIRGNSISMVFQEPMTSLNPVYRCGDQIAEAVITHCGIAARPATDRAVTMLQRVGIADAARTAKAFPHQLSGGMRQRVMIAMALATNPELLIADEPTTALDVTIQAQILELVKSLREQNEMAMILITHDLGVVAEMADEVAVMYAGKVVEQAGVSAIFATPHHPYTRGLLGSMPRLGQKRRRLAVIEGTIPNPLQMPGGCRFMPRCPSAMPICAMPPPLRKVAPPSGAQTRAHLSRCWLSPDGGPPEVGEDPGADRAAEAALLLNAI